MTMKFDRQTLLIVTPGGFVQWYGLFVGGSRWLTRTERAVRRWYHPGLEG